MAIPFNGTDGSYPVVGLIQANDGTLYGITFDRGTDSNGNSAFGNIYKIQGLPPVH